jgi:hypothetical protein
MVDSALVPAIREAIKQNEIGDASPYCLSYACLGTSGASFGVFQGDTNVNQTARATLVRILQAAGTGADAIARISAAVSQPCPRGNPLNASDTAVANAALASTKGKAIVDGMDSSLLHSLLGELDGSIAAAAGRKLIIDPVALLYIALWVNMTGGPDTLDKWLAGTEQLGVAPPAGPTVTQHDIQTYLRASAYFRQHPKNFAHMQNSVETAADLLPPSPAPVAIA